MKAIRSAFENEPRMSARMKAMVVTIIVGPKCAAVAYARTFFIRTPLWLSCEVSVIALRRTHWERDYPNSDESDTTGELAFPKSSGTDFGHSKSMNLSHLLNKKQVAT